MVGSFRIGASGVEARKGVCNSLAEPMDVSGEMSGGLALKRFLKVLQLDAFDAGEAVGGCAGKEKNFARDGVLPKGLWGLGLR